MKEKKIVHSHFFQALTLALVFLFATTFVAHADINADLIESGKEVSSVAGANPLTRPPKPQRFRSEILGGGQIGWTDGTADWIRQRANTILANIAVK